MLSERVSTLRQLNGPISVLTLDSLPIIGRSSRFENLFFLTGFSSTNIKFRQQAARLLAEQVIMHELGNNNGQAIIPEFSPTRFNL